VRRWLGIYRALLRIAFLGQIQYRASAVIWMIGSILEPLVFLVVWSTVARAQGGEVAGFGEREFAAYYITMLVVNHLTFSWVMHDFQYRIQFGSFSFELVRPIHPIHEDISQNLAYKALMLVIVTPAVALMVWGFEPHFELEGWALAAFVPVLLLAFAMRFLFEWALALLAFWTTRVASLNQIYFAVLMFLSGRIAPLAVFPGWLQDAAHALPFYYAIAFPVELFLGRVGPDACLRGVLLQLFWLAVAGATIASAWRLAARRFEAVGQ
jgi:ABC-2 type transport system permease protein